MANNRLVLSNRRTPLLQKFMDNVIADGGTVEEEALAYAWNNTPAYIRQHTSGVLLPGATKASTLYLMKPDGSLGNTIAFGRSTVATRIDINGNLVDVPANQPIINYDIDLMRAMLVLEHAATNDIPNSHGFTGLTIDDSAASTATPAYQGATVKSFTRSLTSSEISYGTRGYGVFTFSAFVKAVNADTATLFVYKANGNKYLVHLNFSTGAVTSTGSVGTSIQIFFEKYANGWYRIMIQGNEASTITKFGLGGTDATQTVGTTLLTHSWQMQNSNATSYIKTTGSAATKSADAFSSFVSASVPIPQFSATGEGSIAFCASWTAGTAGISMHGGGFPGSSVVVQLNPRIVGRFDGGGAVNITSLGLPPVYWDAALDKLVWRTKTAAKDSLAYNNIITNSAGANVPNAAVHRNFNNFQGPPTARNAYLYMAFFNTYLPDNDFKALSL